LAFGPCAAIVACASACATGPARQQPFVQGPAQIVRLDGKRATPSVRAAAADALAEATKSRPALPAAPQAETVDRALKEALAALATSPTVERHLRVAGAYLRLGITDVAVDHFTAATQLEPSAAAAWDGLARIWRDWGLPHVGLANAYRAVYHAPASAEAHNTLGTLLHAMGRADAARREYEMAVALQPGSAWAWSNLCALALVHGFRDNDDAAACRKATQLDPALGVARQNLASLERKLGLSRAACGGVGWQDTHAGQQVLHVTRRYALPLIHDCGAAPASGHRTDDERDRTASGAGHP
jgi:Flp pilus assembly protein TadD